MMLMIATPRAGEGAKSGETRAGRWRRAGNDAVPRGGDGARAYVQDPRGIFVVPVVENLGHDGGANDAVRVALELEELSAVRGARHLAPPRRRRGSVGEGVLLAHGASRRGRAEKQCTPFRSRQAEKARRTRISEHNIPAPPSSSLDFVVAGTFSRVTDPRFSSLRLLERRNARARF